MFKLDNPVCNFYKIDTAAKMTDIDRSFFYIDNDIISYLD